LVPEAVGADHAAILGVSLVVLALGSGVALAFYRPSDSDPLLARSPGLFRSLAALATSFDSVYGYYVAKIQQRFAMLLNFLDVIGLAGIVVRGVAGAFELAGLGARALHNGRVNVYVYWFLAGVAVLWAFASGIL
jgi:NADH-quinone oxidoreductase subunit L